MNRPINNIDEAYDAINEFYKENKGKYANEFGYQKENLEYKEIILADDSKIFAWVLVTMEAVDDSGKLYAREYCA